MKPETRKRISKALNPYGWPTSLVVARWVVQASVFILLGMLLRKLVDML